jgi:hypothetical protein
VPHSRTVAGEARKFEKYSGARRVLAAEQAAKEAFEEIARPNSSRYQSDANDLKPIALISRNFCFVFCPTR